MPLSRPLIVLFAMLSGISQVRAAEIAPSAEKTEPLRAGAVAPRETLPDLNGKSVALVSGQPTIVIFYRGGWCPYCNTHLSDVQKIEQDLLRLGFRILAVSPETMDASKATAEKDALNYTLLSDHEMKASQAFGVAYRVDDATVERYKGFGIKLTATPDGNFWMPVPAVFIIGKNGKIAFAHADADYKKRLSAEALQAAARAALRSE